MKKIIIQSLHLKKINKWHPNGYLRKAVPPEGFIDSPISFPKIHFDTKEEANNYFKDYFIKQGYKEDEIETRNC